MNSARLSGVGMTSERTRERMVQVLQQQGISNVQVLDAIRKVPRHIFLDEALAHRAYEDCALPIGFEQTLSQPYIVARMTELLLADGIPENVLEIGTGSGYQTAVLAQLIPEVFTLERIKPLQDKAMERHAAMQLKNVRYAHADGHAGWRKAAPFEGIMATAAPAEIPINLVQQLSLKGRLVMPVGASSQELQVIRRTSDGMDVESVEPVRFVPLQQGVVC